MHTAWREEVGGGAGQPTAYITLSSVVSVPSLAVAHAVAHSSGSPQFRKPARELRAALLGLREELSPLSCRREAASTLRCRPTSRRCRCFRPTQAQPQNRHAHDRLNVRLRPQLAEAAALRTRGSSPTSLYSGVTECASSRRRTSRQRSRPLPQLRRQPAQQGSACFRWPPSPSGPSGVPEGLGLCPLAPECSPGHPAASGGAPRSLRAASGHTPTSVLAVRDLPKN